MPFVKKEWLLSIMVLAALIVSGCASAFNSRGLNLTAEANFTQVVKEFEPPEGNYEGLPFSDLIYLCTAYGELKDYSKLFPCLETAQKKVNEGDCIADTWNHSATPSRLKATALIELGRYEEAVRAAEASCKIVTDMNLTRYEEVKVLDILGLAYALSGKTAEAETIAQKLMDLNLGFPYQLVKDDRNIAVARIFIALKKYKEAINAISYKFEASNTFFKTIGGWDVFVNNKLSFEFMKNKSLFEVGRWSEAKDGYDALLKYPYIRDRGEMCWNILFDRGRIAEKEGKAQEAIEFYESAVELIEQHRSTINVDASKIGFVGDKQAVYESLIQSLYEDGQFEKAFEYVERSKSRALVDVLAGKQNFAVKVAGQEAQLRSIIALMDRAEAETAAFDNPENKSQTRGLAVEVKRDLQREAPELASLVTVNSIPIAEIQSLISKGEALVEYYYSKKDIYVFVLTQGGLQSVKISSEGLFDELADFRKSLDTPASKQTKELGRKLYQRLFKPLEAVINERDLIIVPHGALHYIPMSALHNGKEYMIDRFNIRLMPSASAMKYLQEKRTDKKRGILIIGNPDLGNPAYDLAFAQKEALEVAKIWPDSKVFLRGDATEETLNRYRDNYAYIHFATHGEFFPDRPLQSAILLAPNADSNGMLTVDKLYSMHLSADLVTLSACETGLGKVANGDDLVGLTRGFLYAGSSSIVASLWQVDDLSTSHLMIQFYKHLKKNDKRTALRKAQLETREKYPHPYYWASFQLTGSGR